MAHYTLARHYTLRGYDWNAVLYDGDIYCDTDTHSCLPRGISTENNPDLVTPLFATTEPFDYIPSCCVCGREHEYLGPC